MENRADQVISYHPSGDQEANGLDKLKSADEILLKGSTGSFRKRYPTAFRVETLAEEVGSAGYICTAN